MATLAADNRWSMNKWGGTKWGASSTSLKSLAWGVEVDWNGDGFFDANEANRMVGIHGFRGRTNQFQAAGSGWEPWQVGKYVITLENYDRRYDAWNASSPLYPNVRPGCDVRIRVRDMSTTNAPVAVFYGMLSDIIPLQAPDGSQRVQLTVEDAWAFLRNNKAHLSVQQNVNPHTEIGAILDAVGWPARWGRLIWTSTDVIPWYWIPTGATAGRAIEDLANSFLDQFIIDATGRARYATRQGQNRSFSTAINNVTSDIVHKEISLTQPWVNKRNLIRIVVNPRTQAASQVVWTLQGAAPAIAAGASLVFIAKYSYNGSPCPANGIAGMTPTSDWTTNTQANGAGTDKTANCTCTLVDYGDSGQVTLKNNDAGTVYLTFARINGNPVYALNPIDVTWPADASTVVNPREFKQDYPWQQDIGMANILLVGTSPYLGYNLSFFISKGFPNAIVKMSGRAAYQFAGDLQAYFQLSITGYHPPSSGSDRYYVGGIAHDSQDEGCQDILTTFYLEPRGDDFYT